MTRKIITNNAYLEESKVRNDVKRAVIRREISAQRALHIMEKELRYGHSRAVNLIKKWSGRPYEPIPIWEEKFGPKFPEPEFQEDFEASQQRLTK